MKKIIIVILCICFFISTVSFSSYAETSQEETAEGNTEGQQREYDSVYMPDDIMAKLSTKDMYENAVKNYGDEIKASLEYGFDIRLLNDDSGFVRIYCEYDPREDILSGKPISDSAKEVQRVEYIKVLTDERIVQVRLPLKPWILNLEEYNESNRDLPDISFYDYIFNTKSLFESVEATRQLGEIEILQTYVFQSHGRFEEMVGKAYNKARPMIVYFVTDKGDYVLYNCCNFRENSYLFDLETFKDITKKLIERENFYDCADIENENHIEGLADLSSYLVGKNVEQEYTGYDKYPFFKNDPEFMGYAPIYHFAKGMGFNKTSELRNALIWVNPGYRYAFISGGLIYPGQLEWSNFVAKMGEAGYTTYAQCRAALDAAVEEGKKNPDSVNIPEEELSTLIEAHKEKYDELLSLYGDKSFDKLGFHIINLLSKQNYVKIFHNESAFDELGNGKTVYEVMENSNAYIYKLFSTKNDGYLYVEDSYDTERFAENYIDGYATLQEYVLSPHRLFMNVEITKSLNDIIFEKMYIIDDFKNDTNDSPSFLIYYVTNYGDYVYYAPSPYAVSDVLDTDKIYSADKNDFLIPAEKFYEVITKSKKISDFYNTDRKLDGDPCLDIYKLVDSSYSVGTPAYPEEIGIGDSSYDMGIGLGYDCYVEFEKDVQAGGYEDIESFKTSMEELGYTTYAQCRAALDAAIEEKQQPESSSDESSDESSESSETTPPEGSSNESSESADESSESLETTDRSGETDNAQNNISTGEIPDADEKNKYAFLLWAIPTAAVLAGGVIALIIRKRKNK